MRAFIRPAIVGAVASIVATLIGCEPGTKSQSASTAAAVKPTTNVVIFLIDTLRADHVGCYGYDKPTSPTMDALANQGVRFANAYAPAPWTCPSVPSILTSTFQCEHGIISELTKLSPEIRTIAERFKGIDYHTASFYTNDFAGPTTGMDRGFDVCERDPDHMGAIEGPRIAKWADTKPAGPFFLYVHNLEPHNPFHAPDQLIPLFGNVSPTERQRFGQLFTSYRQALRPDWQDGKGLANPLGTTNREPLLTKLVTQLDAMLDEHKVLYDAVVRLSDIRLGGVIDALKAKGLWDDTLFIVLADHGEEHAERGDYAHSQSVYDELARVPLIVRFPHDEFAGTVVNDVVTLVDVLPTVFDYLGRSDLSEGARGMSLMPEVRGNPQPGNEFVVTTIRINNRKWRPHWESRGNINIVVLTRNGDWKGIWNVEKGTFELYDLRKDPGEKYNQCAAHPELAKAMVEYASDWYKSCTDAAKGTSAAVPTSDAMQGLEALGYVGGSEDVDDSLFKEVDQSEFQPIETNPCPVDSD